MNELKRARPSPAMVVAVIALILSLGGAAYAGVKIGKGAVGAKQLKGNAVTTDKIQNGAVTAAKVQDGAIGSAKIADGGVSTADLPGCAPGTQLVDGLCLDTAARTADDWVAANTACGQAGGRLPGPGHLISMRGEPGIDLGATGSTANWADSLYEDSGTFEVVAISDTGAREELGPASPDRPFRCIYERVR
jgi:hypothetical protein